MEEKNDRSLAGYDEEVCDEKNFVRRSFGFFPTPSPVRRTVRIRINLQPGKLRVEPRPRRAAEESKRIGAGHRENRGGPRVGRRGAERAAVWSVEYSPSLSVKAITVMHAIYYAMVIILR